MTTTSILDERGAVQIAATLDTTRPDYQEAVQIALSRRGSRDALIVQLARQGDWATVLDVFHGIRGETTKTNANIDAIYAAAHAIAGSPAIAAAISRLHPDNKMLELIGKLIERDVPVTDWIGRMAKLDPETCYAFKD